MKPNELVSYIIDYLNNNINRFVSIDELSFYFGYEKSYIMKVFKRHIGITIKDYQNNRRILNSIKGIYNGDNLLRVALNNGFNSLEYYSEMFTKIVGVNPSIYRKFLKHKSSNKEIKIINVFLDKTRDLNIKLLTYRVYGNKVLRLEIPKEKKY
jgi:AraC-like DNA-binding protein